ncbi:MAG TPA: serine hydrolase [Aeromicrobium sp.]|nr:serine hydrolase [Aeromicrobium sp.]
MVARALASVLVCALTACGAASTPSPDSPSISVTPTPTPGVATESPAPTPADDESASLAGDTRNAIAWAPLSDPTDITVEGSVPRSRAWSTSKVLVIAAYLDTVVGGEPDAIPVHVRGWIQKALAESDNNAIDAIRREIPGSQGQAMTRILRAIGDTTTTAPDAYIGRMHWDVAEQVRFMAALGNGEVVSREASAYLLEQMQPIPEQQWGLGSIGARAFKPGWVNAQTETRQMGIVGDYAVAIITAGDGPATRQGDGDFAHERQLDRLARLFATRVGL